MSSPPRGVLVASSLNLDVSIAVSRAPDPSETVGDGSVEEGLGGKGANTAVAATRALADALPVQLAAARGTDAAGDRLTSSLAALGVDVSHVILVTEAPTGAAYIVVDAAGENRIIVAAGANARFGSLLVPRFFEAVDAAAVVVLHLEIPAPAVSTIVRAARERGAKVVLNPSPVAAAEGLTPSDWGCIDFCIVNEIEAAKLSGVPGNSVEAARALGELCADGCVVVVTRGERSVVFLEAGEVGYVEAVKARRVVDSTSAGDTGKSGAFISLHFTVDHSRRLTLSLQSPDTLQRVLRRGCGCGKRWRLPSRRLLSQSRGEGRPNRFHRGRLWRSVCWRRKLERVLIKSRKASENR